ncbi:MAG: DNA polymerase IV [Sphingopyxis sp.]
MTDDAPVPPLRKIIHVDMDAFFASVEQRDNPQLRGRPVAVGGSSKRGVVAAASYEARRFGVRSAMPSVTAARACPDLIFVKPRFDVYRQVSGQIRAIFHSVADAVEPLSLDEAYMDVTLDKGGFGSATATARHIRAQILAQTGLTASAGVSTNKLIAKLASDQHKPDGLTVVPPGQEAAFVQTLSVRRLHGVGPVTATRLEGMGLWSVADLAACPRDELAQIFRNNADWLLAMANGIDNRPVREDRQRKSLGAERTFETDLTQSAELTDALSTIVDAVWDRAVKAGDGPARTVTLKLKYADFRQITRARTPDVPVGSHAALAHVAAALLRENTPPPQGVRLMGVTLSGFATPAQGHGGAVPDQLPLFSLA